MSHPSVPPSLEEVLQYIRSAPQAPDQALAAVAEAAVVVLAQLERWPELAEVASAGVLFAGPANPFTALRLLHNRGIGEQYLNEPAFAAQTFTLVSRLAGEVGMPDLQAQALAHLGQVLFERHEPEQAIDKLHQALVIFKRLGDRLGEARCYGNLAPIVAEFDDEDLALRYTEDARSIFAEIGDRSGEARTLVALAEDRAERGDFESAIDLLSAAKELFDAAHEPARAGSSAFTAARLARMAGDDRLAEQYAQAALIRLVPLGHELVPVVRHFLAEALNDEQPDTPALPDGPGLGLFVSACGEMNSGQLTRAADQATEAAELLCHEGNEELAAEALVVAAIARRNIRNGNLAAHADLAIAALRRALRIYRKKTHPYDWARAMATLAIVYRQHPQDRPRNLRRALHRLRAALTVFTREEHPQNWATTMTNLGLVLSDRAMTSDPENMEEARRCLREALRELADPAARASTALNLSLVYRERLRGDLDANHARALRYAQQARDLYSQLGQPVEVAVAMRAMADALAQSRGRAEQTDIRKALDLYREALALISVDDDPVEYANICDNLSNTLSLLDDPTRDDLREAAERNRLAAEIYERHDQRYDAAAAHYNLALSLEHEPDGDLDEVVEQHRLALAGRPVAEVPLHWLESANELARTLILRDGPGDLACARSLLDRSAPLAVTLSAPDLAWPALQMLGRLHTFDDDWTGAADIFHRAVAIADTRYEAAGLAAGRAAELYRIGGLHREAAYAVARAGDVHGAVALLERARAREVARLLDRDGIDLAGLRDLDPRLAEDYRNATEELQVLEALQRRHDIGTEQRYQLYGRITGAEARLRSVRAEIRSQRGLTDFATTSDVADASGILHSGEVIAYLVAAERGSVALIVGPDGTTQAVYAPLTETELISALLTTGELWSRPVLDLLGGQFLGIVAARLAVLGVEQIIVVGTGLLSALPVHAARYTRETGSRCLIDEMDVAYAPSARVLQAARVPRLPDRPRRLLTISDPLRSAASLPGTVAETAAVRALFASGGTGLSGREATQEALLAALPGTTHLHVACHAAYEPVRPFESGILLAGSSMVTLRDLFDGHLLSGVRLAVASACETAVTDLTRTPEEALGLPTGLLYSGAATAIGSLWPVSDQTAPVLMCRFYRNYLQGDPGTGEGPMRPARALSRAQAWLRNATATEVNAFAADARLPRVFHSDSDRRRLAELPEHWAPFVVVGDA
ncbi:CHAT domain-containing protein [Micromonospora sp. NPDC005173]|uniref:CHAT domain-containing protein n=1 Tax=Micromonospora sp. NPDC005173 TaxID=3157165 RepID=UPI00339F9AB5